MLECKLNLRDVSHSILLVVTLLILIGSLESAQAFVNFSLTKESKTTVTSPPVELQQGTTDSSTIYANGTSAKVSTAAPAPTPTYYPTGNNTVTGTYVSGDVPNSVQNVDTDYFIVRSSATAPSTTEYYPSGATLLGSTTLVSGASSDLVSNNGFYMTFRSYASATSTQMLFAHQETTSIGGTNYYLKKLESADAAGTSLSASMAATGRQLFGKFVYPLTGVNVINASTWTMYYRAWQDPAQSIAFDANSSGTNGAGSTSVSWSHTTGSGLNRIMIVGVSIRNTTVSVSGITYGVQSLTFIRADTQGTSIRSELWYLIAPASGTATVTVTLSASSRATGGSVTYTGVAQTLPIDVHGGGTGLSSSPSQSVTVSTANSWLLGHLAISGSGKTVTAEGSGQTMRWDQETSGGSSADRNRGHGSGKGPVGTGSQTMSWTLSGSENWAVSVVAFKPASVVGHVDIDILIRQSDGAIRTTRATNVANSVDLTSAASTLSGTYSWSAYTVVDQSDYLEIDYYVEVTTAAFGMSAYLRIDDGGLPTDDQTRATNIYLPSEFTSEVVFTGSSNTGTWTELVWTIDSAWTIDSVSVIIQVYNYTLDGYPNSGNGYDSYTSSATAYIDETRTQTITTNPQDFRNSTGYWKIKVKGVKTTTTQFDFKADWVEFKPTYSGYSVSTEFLFSSMTKNTPTQLNFTVVNEYDIASVNVTIQVWNYNYSDYAQSGSQGYLTYISSSANETKYLNITTNPANYTSNGNAKIKITGVLTTTTQFQQKVNQLKLAYSYSSSSTYDYVLRVVNKVTASWKVKLQVYNSINISRLSSANISFYDGATSEQIKISDGNITQSGGPAYDLPGPANTTIRIKITDLQATNSEVSTIYVYLKVQVPDKSTYSIYIITFEIT